MTDNRGVLNNLLVKLFNDILRIEEKSLKKTSQIQVMIEKGQIKIYSVLFVV